MPSPQPAESPKVDVHNAEPGREYQDFRRASNRADPHVVLEVNTSSRFVALTNLAGGSAMPASAAKWACRI